MVEALLLDIDPVARPEALDRIRLFSGDVF
jgi:hypothetical protein